MTESEMKEWIDNASYEELLQKQRFAPIGHSMFRGNVGKYFQKKFRQKREALQPYEQVQASKSVGWD